jgi:hypothetical protein
VLDGKGAEGQDVVGRVVEVGDDVDEAGLGQLVGDVGQLGPGGVSVGLFEDRTHQGGDHRPVRLGAARVEVGHEVQIMKNSS